MTSLWCNLCFHVYIRDLNMVTTVSADYPARDDARLSVEHFFSFDTMISVYRITSCKMADEISRNIVRLRFVNIHTGVTLSNLCGVGWQSFIGWPVFVSVNNYHGVAYNPCCLLPVYTILYIIISFPWMISLKRIPLYNCRTTKDFFVANTVFIEFLLHTMVATWSTMLDGNYCIACQVLSNRCWSPIT